jgi:hypothetical protein
MKWLQKTLIWGFHGLWISASVVGCQQIIGIEDRTQDPQLKSGGTSAPASAQCQAYCKEIQDGCTGEFAQYSSMDTCLGVCKQFAEGDPGNPTGNNLACRKQQAGLAVSTGETNVHCKQAGPGGAGVCGSNCESYCFLYEKVCPDDFALVPNCVSACAGVRDVGSFDVKVNHDGDNIQCRLVHTSSATVDKEGHCWHARLAPAQDSPCADNPETATPSCEQFCQLNLVACTGDKAVYESNAQCMAVCKALDLGKTSDRVEDTVGCRTYHSYSSLADPVTHCNHTGPGGDGHCGPKEDANCPAYCKLSAAACPTQFAGAFTDAADCKIKCQTIAGNKADSKYSVATAQSGNTLQCRLLATARALTDPASCEAAFGGGACAQ